VAHNNEVTALNYSATVNIVFLYPATSTSLLHPLTSEVRCLFFLRPLRTWDSGTESAACAMALCFGKEMVVTAAISNNPAPVYNIYGNPERIQLKNFFFFFFFPIRCCKRLNSFGAEFHQHFLTSLWLPCHFLQSASAESDESIC
jgi:hypothetical protein